MSGMNSPSERLIAEASRCFTVEDEDGRRIGLRAWTAYDQLRLYRAVPAGLVENQPYLGMLRLAAAVTEIDDVPVPAGFTEAGLMDVVRRLGDAGMRAVGRALDPSRPAAEGAPGN